MYQVVTGAVTSVCAVPCQFLFPLPSPLEKYTRSQLDNLILTRSGENGDSCHSNIFVAFDEKKTKFVIFSSEGSPTNNEHSNFLWKEISGERGSKIGLFQGNNHVKEGERNPGEREQRGERKQERQGKKSSLELISLSLSFILLEALIEDRETYRWRVPSTNMQTLLAIWRSSNVQMLTEQRGSNSSNSRTEPRSPFLSLGRLRSVSNGKNSVFLDQLTFLSLARFQSWI